MLISHSKKFVFIKTEKTASTSCEIFLRQFCAGEADIVTPISPVDEAIARRLGVSGPKNYFLRSNQRKAKLVEAIHRSTRFLPAQLLPNALSPRRGIDLSAHSKAIELYRLIEPGCADLSSYFIFGFTRHPVKRFASFLNYKKVFHYWQDADMLQSQIIRHARYIFEPTSRWFCDIQGVLLASKVYKYEHLEDSLSHACGVLGLIPNLKFSEVPKTKDSSSGSPNDLHAGALIRQLLESQEIRELICQSHDWEMNHFYSA